LKELYLDGCDKITDQAISILTSSKKKAFPIPADMKAENLGNFTAKRDQINKSNLTS